MKYSRRISFFFLLFMHLTSYCQTKVKAWFVDGMAEYSYDLKNWHQIAEKTEVTDEAYIRLKQDAVVLLHKDDYEAYVNNQEYNYKQIKSIPFPRKIGLWSQISNMFSHYISTTEPQYRPNAIKRGELCQLLLPGENEIMLERSAMFLWQKNNKDSFKFSLIEESNGSRWLCKDVPITDTSLLLDNFRNLDNFHSFDTTAKYQWNVRSKQDNNNRDSFRSFVFANNYDRDGITSDLNKIAPYHEIDNGILYTILKAMCYEQHNMFTESYNVYKEALKSHPGSALLNQAYEQFILRLHSE
jgi:hypothetical protein